MPDQPEKHVCGTCSKEFAERAGYIGHTCSKTGEKPNTIAHLDKTSGGQFSKASEAALARGEARKEA